MRRSHWHFLTEPHAASLTYGALGRESPITRVRQFQVSPQLETAADSIHPPTCAGCRERQADLPSWIYRQSRPSLPSRWMITLPYPKPSTAPCISRTVTRVIRWATAPCFGSPQQKKKTNSVLLFSSSRLPHAANLSL